MRRKLVLVAMTTLLAAASLACSTSGSGEGDARTTTSAVASSGDDSTSATSADDESATEADGPAERTAEPEAIVASLAPTEADLEAGEQLVLRELGDEVEGQVTLDYCSDDFESEADRIARRQLNIVGDDEVAGSVEVVLYDGGADAALDEVRAAIEACPEDELVDPAIEGQPAYVWDDEPVDEADLDDVAEDHVAVTATVTDEDGTTQTQTVIWQVRGDALIATYSSDESRAIALAEAGNTRLESATPADLGL